MSGTLGAFAIKVQENSAAITDEHIAVLKAAGYSDEQIFECIVAAAVGAVIATSGFTAQHHRLKACRLR